MKPFNDLLNSILIVDIKNRPTIKEVLSHNFLKDHRKTIYLRLNRPINDVDIIDDNVKHYMMQYINNLHRNDESLCEEKKINILNHACNIYNKCHDLYISHEHKSKACVWIASKLLYGHLSHVDIPSTTLLQHEKDICHNLEFLI
jgi:hypothetical protein